MSGTDTTQILSVHREIGYRHIVQLNDLQIVLFCYGYKMLFIQSAPIKRRKRVRVSIAFRASNTKSSICIIEVYSWVLGVGGAALPLYHLASLVFECFLIK